MHVSSEPERIKIRSRRRFDRKTYPALITVTNDFKISFLKLGPTEFRLALIVINGLIVRFGLEPVKGALPYIALGGSVVLAILAFHTQTQLWRIDIAAKHAEEKAASNSPATKTHSGASKVMLSSYN